MYNIWNVSWLSIPSFTAWDPHWGFLERGLLCLWQTEGCASVFFSWLMLHRLHFCVQDSSTVYVYIHDFLVCKLLNDLWVWWQGHVNLCTRALKSGAEIWWMLPQMPERPRRMVQVLQLHFGIDRQFMVFQFCIPCQYTMPEVSAHCFGCRWWHLLPRYWRQLPDDWRGVFFINKKSGTQQSLPTCLDFFPSFWKLISCPLLLVIAEHCSGGLPLCSPGRASD